MKYGLVPGFSGDQNILFQPAMLARSSVLIEFPEIRSVFVNSNTASVS